MMPDLKICSVSSEVVPYVKTGGLADVAGALGKYLSNRGCEVRIFLPFYDNIDTAKHIFHQVNYLQNISIEFGSSTLHFSVITSKLPDSQADVYFINCEGLYNRRAIYTDQPDEYLRFAMLCRAAIECCQRMGWGPDIFHCHDWQAALIPLYLKTVYSWDQLFAKTKTALTIHNIAFQGIFPSDVIDELELGKHRQKLPKPDLDSGMINFLKIGMLNCDVVTTVSETYAQEIKTTEYGSGLETILQQRSDRLIGIVNGVDYNEWSPEKDPYIVHKYSAKNISGKEKNKKLLLKKMGLPYHPASPVYGIVSRLTPQKGLELIYEILFDILSSTDLRFVVLGSGEQKYADLFREAQQHFPDKLFFYDGYNDELSHLIQAGSDVFVMPSRYEPCGLTQIYSLKYGTVPIVRKTGGLADTVQLYDWETQKGTGFVFEDFSAQGLRWAMEYSLETFKHKKAWKTLMLNGMSQNYSWDLQVEKYLELYKWMLQL